VAAPDRRPGWQPPSTLPPLYAEWVTSLLDGPPPHEPEATCESCAMWPPQSGPATPTEVFFHRDTKCCTYLPDVANFLVGRILDDPDPALAPGRASVERRIDDRVGVTPVGLLRTPVHELLYQHGAPSGFGRATSLRCPHYRVEAGGACGIWRHRNSVCSTWFCKYGRGATGQKFWHALEQLLAIVEKTLARWCVLEIGVDSAVLARLLPRGADRGVDVVGLDAASLDGTVSPETYRALWGSWQGRERELFRRAAAMVNDLGWTDVARIGGANVDGFARVVVDAYRRHGDDSLPGRLTVGTFQTLTVGRERVRVMTYNPYDPLELPRLLVDVLPYFDGRPTAQALRRIRTERGVNVQPELVRRLVDFGVLIEGA
jgi:hypothetical protein